MPVNTLQICFLTSLFIMCPNRYPKKDRDFVKNLYLALNGLRNRNTLLKRGRQSDISVSINYVILGFFKNSVTGTPESVQNYVPHNRYAMHLMQVSNDWVVDVMKDKSQGRINTEELNKPGFDYSEKEMIKFKIWPQGIIPYFIDDVSFDKVFRDRIRGFLDNVNTLTGLQFMELPRPPQNETMRWVFFINRRGLQNTDGITTNDLTNYGVQKVVLGYDGVSTRGELCQAVLALAGVPPQHNAPDRNQHVVIQAKNILPEKKHLFYILNDNEWLFHNLAYDFSSAGHYPFHKYTANGFATIKPKVDKRLVGEGNGFSYTDILKIRMLYNYISKKRTGRASLSDCKKMFKPGPNFKRYKHTEEASRPRSKPKKYLDKSRTKDYSKESTETEDENNDKDATDVTENSDHS